MKCQNLAPIEHVNFVPAFPPIFLNILQLPSVKWLRVGKLCLSFAVEHSLGSKTRHLLMTPVDDRAENTLSEENWMVAKKKGLRPEVMKLELNTTGKQQE